MSTISQLAPDTTQRMIAEARWLRPDPITLTLPDGSTIEGEVAYSAGGYGVEMRLMVEGRSSLGIGATVTVYAPEVTHNYCIESAYIMHSTGGGRGENGGAEASIALLTLAIELRDLLNAEAPEALAPEIARLERSRAEQAAEQAAKAEQAQAIRERLESFLLYGSRVRWTTKAGKRKDGTLAPSENGSRLHLADGSSVAFDDVALFEVKRGARFEPFALEPEAKS